MTHHNLKSGNRLPHTDKTYDQWLGHEKAEELRKKRAEAKAEAPRDEKGRFTKVC